jgi:hypothetical protein
MAIADKKVQTHIPYGFVTALALILIAVILEVLNLNDTPGMQWLGYAIMIVGLILNAQAFSKANAADITFGQAFSSGFKASAIMAIVMFVWSFILPLVFPGIYERMMEKAQEQMSQESKMTEEQIEAAMGYTKKFFGLLIHAGALFGTLIAGLLFSLIAAAIAKKNLRRIQLDQPM